MKKYNAIDLFCGGGGLTLGLKQAGFNVIAAIEKNNYIANTYKENHPEVKIFNSDIADIDIKNMMEMLSLEPGNLDLLSGCPPCQSFSSLKRLNRVLQKDDKRNELIYEFLKFIEVLQPKAIMLENVAGLSQYNGFKDFIKKIEVLDYKPQYKILDVSDFGVPQRRKRLICLAGKNFNISFGDSLFGKVTVAEAIGKMPKPGKSGDALHDLPTKRTEKVKKIISLIPKNGGSRSSLPEDLILNCHKKCKGFNDIYGRMSWGSVAPTITCGCPQPSKGRFLHPEQDRAITLREASILQGFPLSYKFPLNKTLAGIIIGNALPPPFIKIHALKIIDYLKRLEA